MTKETFTIGVLILVMVLKFNLSISKMKPHHVEESEVRAIAQKVIDQSKSSARVDTGALRVLWRYLHSWRCYL
jgi:hypothetical protein